MKNNPQSETERKDVYQVITDRILDLLQKGVVPWQKPWASNRQDYVPRNLASGKAYRGVNVFLLHAMNFGSPIGYHLSKRRNSGAMSARVKSPRQ